MSIHYLNSGSLGHLTITSSFVPPKSLPTVAEEGSVYYDTTAKRIEVYNGTTWELLAGTSGTSGQSVVGTSGTSGLTGTSGTSGAGTSGTSGTSGQSGTSGTSGSSGSSGTSGTSGLSGTSGTAGSSGVSGVGTSGTSGSGVTYAVQADQETGTSTSVAVNPGVQHFHQSAAKFWVAAQGNSTTISASYNMTSWADTATGQATGTINTDFSSVNWAGMVSVLITTLAWDATYTTGCGFGTQAVGTFRVDCSRMTDGGTSVAAFYDPNSWFVAGYGDQ